MIGYVFLFHLLFRWSLLHKVPLVVGWYRSCIQVVSFLWVLTILYSLGFTAIGWFHLYILRLLIFLPAILIPPCASSSPVFLMMYSAYKLNKQGGNIQPWCTPFPIWNQSVVPCPVLTVASWLAYRFLKRLVRWSGIPIFQNFPVFCVPHSWRLCRSQ